MKPYNRETTTKSEEVKEMFDNIAPAYDRLNHILSLDIDKRWRRRVVKIVKTYEPELIIDMATGTGDLALALAQALPQSKVVGIDLSPGMLEVAKVKIKEAKLSDRVEVLCGAAESIEMASEVADVVSVAFGVRNFGDLQQGLCEMCRVVKGGGHLVVLEFSTPDNPLFRWCYNLYSRHILPFIGGLISRDRRAYEYLPASVEEFASPREFIEMMERAGCVECEVKSLSFGIARIYVGQKNSIHEEI
ncbi:MAG: bifunctional demethylmenaquinone methyltransferase/2-methoxy-6-polyprenyl-1,4-benzoquinol methylase UbiE [Rikenellaceae bacterium]